MALVRYRRTGPEPRGAVLGPAIGTLGLFAIVPGILGTLEVLLVGEEMSALGRRMLPLTQTGGPFSSDTGLYSWAPLIVGGPVFALSMLRLVAAVGLCRDHPWAYRLFVGLTLPSLAVDLACLACYFAIPWVAFDLAASLALRRKSR